MKKKEESDKKKEESALHISKGAVPESTIRPELFQKLKRKKHSVEDYVEAILAGDRILLSKAITLIESTKQEHRTMAEAIVEQCLPHTNNSIRIGITGTPGVGKSTFIEAFGKHLIGTGKKVAVLAIDPSSQLTGGSILGDKTRMQDLSVNPDAFIRPSAAGDSLGGVARKTRETIFLCEAAGFDVIIIETVGVGQSETAVHSMVDFFLLLLLPNAGDELQGIKRGVVEMADLIAVNKADGEVITQAKLAKRQYQNALHLFPLKSNKWQPKVELCSALQGTGIAEIWKQVESFQYQMSASGFWQSHRAEQAKFWMQETIIQHLKALFYQHPEVKSILPQVETELLEGKMSSFKAAALLLDIFLTQKK